MQPRVLTGTWKGFVTSSVLEVRKSEVPHAWERHNPTVGLFTHVVLFGGSKCSDASPSILGTPLSAWGCSVVHFPLGLSLPQITCPCILFVSYSPPIRNYQVRSINREWTVNASQDFVLVFISWFPSLATSPIHKTFYILYNLHSLWYQATRLGCGVIRYR